MKIHPRLKLTLFLIGLLPGLIALNGCSTTPVSEIDETAAILTEAHKAYNIKSYKKVFQLIFPLAAAGNDKAQYALGYLFYYETLHRRFHRHRCSRELVDDVRQ